MTTVVQVEDRVLLTNNKINIVVNDFKMLAEARVTFNNTRLVEYINLLQQRANFLYLRFLFHHSPQLLAALTAIWSFFVFIYNGIKIIVEFLHIKELLQLTQVLALVWPAFREKRDAILGKVSEFSKQVGWGTDGLILLLQTAGSGLNIMSGIMGKDRNWFELKLLANAIPALQNLSRNASMIDNDPASVLNWAFGYPQRETMAEANDWWSNTMSWLEDTAKDATTAIQKVNDTIDNLLELENNMPAIVRKNIPSWLSDGITWIDTQIDNTILPALTNLTNEFIQINAQLEAERVRAAELAEQLSRPGDLLERVERLQGFEREEQQRKMDEAVSAQFMREADEGEQQNAGIMAKFQAITDALKEVPPALEFLAYEDMKRSTIKIPGVVIYRSWDIYDFVLTT